MAAFADHFLEKSALYAAARPVYPAALFEYLASLATAHDRAWDCATGSGQAAAGLARHFARVDASDASAEQIASAPRVEGVVFRVEPAESPSFADRSFDCVCVAQALHWFDLERFHREVHRVLKPGGIFAAWGYVSLTVDPAFDAAFEHCVLRPLHPLWPEQNRKLWRGYRDLPFPYAPADAPDFAIEVAWTFAQLLDYVGTWSATRALQRQRPDFLAEVRALLAAAWGPEEARRIIMPLYLRVGRHEG